MCKQKLNVNRRMVVGRKIVYLFKIVLDEKNVNHIFQSFVDFKFTFTNLFNKT